MGLTREQILGADDLPRERVHIEEWGGDVWVRTLTAGQRERWELLMEGPDGYRGKGQMLAAIVALTACDEAGGLLFTLDDIPRLADKSAGAVTRIGDAATRLARIEQGDLEALEGNSGASPSDSSASG